jgi:hypothetical protein
MLDEITLHVFLTQNASTFEEKSSFVFKKKKYYSTPPRIFFPDCGNVTIFWPNTIETLILWDVKSLRHIFFVEDIEKFKRG